MADYGDLAWPRLTFANRQIEREFTAWAKAINLAERLRTMRMARAQDGEAFAVLTSNVEPADRHPA